MSSEIEFAWAAGFFDGEGYITIPKRKSQWKTKTYYSHYLRIGVNHVRPEPLKKLQGVLGGTMRLDTKVYGNRSVRYVWSCSTNEAISALSKIQPYLHNKQLEVQIALEFAKTISKDKKQLTTNVVEFREDCALYLKEANAIG